MIDLCVIEIRDLLPVKNIKIAHGVVPRSYYVTGANMRNTYQVFIDEMKCPQVVVVDNTTLLVQAPEQLTMTPRSIIVISNRLTNNTGRSRITFGLGDTTHFISGLERLIQVFLKILLQTPGTDAWQPKLGGGVLRAAGKIGGTARINTIVSDVQLGVERTRQQLISIQANQPQLALSERLLYAKLLEARFSPQEQSLFCTIDIASQSMKSSVVMLEA